MCTVVCLCITGSDVNTSIQLLQAEYSILPPTFSKDSLRELGKEFPEGYQIPESAIRKRLDIRTKSVFTIGGRDERVMNYAFSLDMIPGGDQLLLGVHISDVTYFLKRDCKLDIEASHRAVTSTVYSTDQPQVRVSTQGNCHIQRSIR